jgi:hypothetical protein
MTQGAVSRSQRNAAGNVRVRHRPKGALATSRSPLAHRPFDCFTPTECTNYLTNAGYAST